jgi:hypothetical protein
MNTAAAYTSSSIRRRLVPFGALLALLANFKIETTSSLESQQKVSIPLSFQARRKVAD